MTDLPNTGSAASASGSPRETGRFGIGLALMLLLVAFVMRQRRVHG